MLQQAGLPIKDGRRVSPQGQPIMVEFLNIRLDMRCGLGSVQKDRCPNSMGLLNDLPYRVYRPQRIGDMVEENQLCLFREKAFVGLKVKHSIPVHRDYPEFCSCFVA